MDFLAQAQLELNNLTNGQFFILKDLFPGHIWKSIDSPSRRTLGSLFLEFAKQNPELINILNKDSSNHQKYSKK